MGKLIKKIGIKSTILVIIGLLFITVGLVFNFSEKKGKIINSKKINFAEGDYFSAKLSNQTINKGEIASIPLKIDDISINSGDKGIGVLYFKYSYETDAFSDISFTSNVADITVNKSTKEVIAVVKNDSVLKSTTNILTISLQSNSNTTKTISTFSITNVKGSSGETVPASDASCTISFSETPETPSIIDNTKVIFTPNGKDTYSLGAGSKIDADTTNIKKISYLWIKGTNEPDDSEFTTTISNGGIASTGGVTGDYYLWVLVELNSGEKYKSKSNVFKLDNQSPTKPIISSSNSTSDVEVKHDVNLTIDGSTALSGIEKYEYSFNNGESWNDYNPNTGINITEEGTTTVIARAKNNLGKYSSVSDKYIVKIVREQMNLTYRVSTLETTNSNVTVTITSNTKLNTPAGWTNYNNGYGIYKVYSENTTENVTITDENGNSSIFPIVINQIDKMAPQLEVAYNTSDNYVEAVITSNEKVQEISGWTLSDDEKSLSKIFYHNTESSVRVYDIAGNSTQQQINITGIHEGEFTIDVNYTETESDKVKVTITSSENLAPLDGWTLSNDKKKLEKVFTGDILEHLTINSENNERKNIEIRYSFINENDSDPEFRVVYSNKRISNQSVIVTIVSTNTFNQLEGWELTGDGYALTKIYNSNTDENVIVTFENGETREVNIKITNIDKDKPIISEAVNNGVYDKLKLSVSNDTESVEIEKEGKIIEYQKDMVLTEKGNYKITLIDKAGNTSIYNITINSDVTIVEVPDTGSNYTKALIIIGILELLVGLLYIFKFKVDDRINFSVVIMIFAISAIHPSIAVDALLNLNGYTVNDGKLYNIEALTTQANLKDNLDNDTSITITKNSSSDYMATGDKLKYKGTTYSLIIDGDVNSDGTVNETDFSSIINHLISKTTISDTNKLDALDYNKDNYKDISDLYLLSKRIKSTYTIKPKGVKISAPNSAIDAGHSMTISSKVYPVNAANKTVNYNLISGETYSSISENKIKGTKAGTSKIRASVGSVYSDLTYTINNCYKLHVISFDAADAMVLEANGHYGIIDTGVQGNIVSTGGYAGYNKIDNYLKNIMDGERKELDFMIITHAHSDHIGNAKDIINNYGVKELFAKRYSYMDSCGTSKTAEDIRACRDRLQNTYEEVINSATNKNTIINEYGTESALKVLAAVSNNNSTKTSFNLGAFTIKLHNLSNQLIATNSINSGSENMNSLTQSIKITVNGKTIRTYLEGDLSASNYTRSIPSSVKNNGHLTNKTSASVKSIVMWQAYDYLGLSDNNLDVYKMGHHGFYNGVPDKNELEVLKPKNVFVTAKQSSIEEKSNETKNLCSVLAAKTYLGSKFSTNFKTIDNSIVYDYSSGIVEVTGGKSWSGSVSASGCNTIDIN